MSLVTDGKIHSMANNDNYRDNYDAAFGIDGGEVESLIRQADTEYDAFGLVSTSITSRLIELGIDVSNYA